MMIIYVLDELVSVLRSSHAIEKVYIFFVTAISSLVPPNINILICP